MRHLHWLLAIGLLHALPAEERALICTRTATAPVIDGDLNDPVWSRGVPITGLHQYGSTATARSETVAVMLYDDQRLYLGVLMHKEPGRTLSDGTMWGGDAVEVFLDPGRTRSRYFQVAGNHHERFMAASEIGKSQDTQWPGGMVVAAKPVPGGWSLEMSLPFAPLGKTPKAGEVWAANLCRDDSALGISTFAVLTEGGFHQPARFADLRFVDGPAAEDALTAEATRTVAALGKDCDAWIGTVRDAAVKLRPGSPGADVLRRRFDELATQASALAGPQFGVGLFGAQQKTWVLTALLAELKDNLAWQVKTAGLFE